MENFFRTGCVLASDKQIRVEAIRSATERRVTLSQAMQSERWWEIKLRMCRLSREKDLTRFVYFFEIRRNSILTNSHLIDKSRGFE